jgi:hypothetical protein|nr:MAG TPA: hypothetical protein [Caudoviricetes sp.]
MLIYQSIYTKNAAKTGCIFVAVRLYFFERFVLD